MDFPTASQRAIKAFSRLRGVSVMDLIAQENIPQDGKLRVIRLRSDEWAEYEFAYTHRIRMVAANLGA